MAIPLPSCIDTQAACDLVPTLRAAFAGGSGAIALDGGGVDRIGAAGLQLLVSARRSADMAGRTFALDPVTAPLLTAATLTGAAAILWPETLPLPVERCDDAA